MQSDNIPKKQRFRPDEFLLHPNHHTLNPSATPQEAGLEEGRECLCVFVYTQTYTHAHTLTHTHTHTLTHTRTHTLTTPNPSCRRRGGRRRGAADAPPRPDRIGCLPCLPGPREVRGDRGGRAAGSRAEDVWCARWRGDLPPETQIPKPETRNPRPETRDPRPETRDLKLETRNPRLETRDSKSET